MKLIYAQGKAMQLARWIRTTSPVCEKVWDRVPRTAPYRRPAFRGGSLSRPSLIRLLACSSIVLAGCQTTPAPPLINSAPVVEAKVPVVASCVDEASIDPLPPTAMPPRTAGTDALAAGAAADLLRYRELARRQREILLACSKVK
jgi:hypothetical protein